MSISLSRRDALKGAMAAGAAIAASPYLLNLAGGLSAIPAQTIPAKPATASLPAASTQSAAPSSSQTTVLVIKGDVVSSYRGLQSAKVQDAALASKLRSAIVARYD